MSITHKVFWQSFWYVMAFYVTLPFVLLSFYIEYTSKKHFWILALTAILAPLQGLMNALVYFQRTKGAQKLRRKIAGWLDQSKQKKDNNRIGDSATTERFVPGRSSLSFRPEQSTSMTFLSGDELRCKCQHQDVDSFGPGEVLQLRQEQLRLNSVLSMGDSNGDFSASYQEPSGAPGNHQDEEERDDCGDANNERSKAPCRRSFMQQFVNVRSLEVPTDMVETNGMLSGVVEYWEIHEKNEVSRQNQPQGPLQTINLKCKRIFAGKESYPTRGINSLIGDHSLLSQATH